MKKPYEEGMFLLCHFQTADFVKTKSDMNELQVISKAKQRHGIIMQI